MSEGFGARGDEVAIVLSPDCEQRRFPLPEVFVKDVIQFHVVGIIEKQVQLNVHFARPRHECRVKRVAFRRNQLRVWNPDGIFLVHAFQI